MLPRDETPNPIGALLGVFGDSQIALCPCSSARSRRRGFIAAAMSSSRENRRVAFPLGAQSPVEAVFADVVILEIEGFECL